MFERDEIIMIGIMEKLGACRLLRNFVELGKSSKIKPRLKQTYIYLKDK